MHLISLLVGERRYLRSYLAPGWPEGGRERVILSRAGFQGSVPELWPKTVGPVPELEEL